MIYEVSPRGTLGDGEWSLGQGADFVLRWGLIGVWTRPTVGGYPPGEGSMTFVHGLTDMVENQTQGVGGPLQQEEWSKLWEGMDNYGLAMMMEGVGINQERWEMIMRLTNKLEDKVSRIEGLESALINKLIGESGNRLILFWDNSTKNLRMIVSEIDNPDSVLVDCKFERSKLVEFTVEGRDSRLENGKKRIGIDKIMALLPSIINNPETTVDLAGKDGYYGQSTLG
ncbi:MAG: hypothetical protein WCT01_00905 [Candidatus Shapirobacteria bacterium]